MSASMASMTPASTADMSMSTGMSMGGMGGMDMGSGKCKISMLWNWYTVDACEFKGPSYILLTSITMVLFDVFSPALC